MLFDSRTTLQSASIPFQFLADVVDRLQGESDDVEFVSSFALQFLLMECISAWALCMGTSSTLASRECGPRLGALLFVISGVCGSS